MPITQEDVDRVLAVSWAYHNSHGAVPSDNIVFLDPQNEAQRRHNENAAAANEKILQEHARQFIAAMRGATPTLVEEGESLVGRGVTAGRCGEMTAVTGHFCRADPQMASKMVEMWAAMTDETENKASHAFLIVTDGAKLSGLLQAFSIESLAAIDEKEGVWVIDTWLPIACHASVYKDKLMQMLREFDDPAFENKGTTKVIMVTGMSLLKDASGTLRPTAVPEQGEIHSAQEWGESIIAAPLSDSRQLELPQRRLTEHGHSVREGQPSSHYSEQSEYLNVTKQHTGPRR
jgi:hypothetical protein